MTYIFITIIIGVIITIIVRDQRYNKLVEKSIEISMKRELFVLYLCSKQIMDILLSDCYYFICVKIY